MASAVIGLYTWTARANPQSSASYAIDPDATDFGGGHNVSALYANDGSLTELTGTASVAAPAEMVKHSYIGQLYEVTSFQITATPATVNESATRQLAATAVLDDLTTLPYAANQVTWSVVTGPIASINTSGLATAATVYQDTAATVRGTAGTATGTLGLTVLNVGTDNFGTYAGDGIDDAWQVLYFGTGNPAAGPLLDPDNDGFNNLFEYLACLVPGDRLSTFSLRVETVPGQPLQRRIIISPRLAGCTYTLQFSPGMAPATWNTLSGAAISDNGSERTFTHLNAPGGHGFYRIQVSRP